MGTSDLNQAPLEWKKLQNAALRMVFNDYTADYDKLLGMSERTPLLVVRPTDWSILVCPGSKVIWSCMYITHKFNIPSSRLSHKSVLYLIHQKFYHFHLGIVHCHSIGVMCCIVYIVFHCCLLSTNNPCGCLLVVASAKQNETYLVLIWIIIHFLCLLP